MYLAKSLAEKLYLFQVRMELHAGKWGKPVLRELGGGAVLAGDTCSDGQAGQHVGAGPDQPVPAPSRLSFQPLSKYLICVP